MKVLIITNVFPNSAEEIRGIFTYQIVKALQEKCDVEVVAPLPWVPPLPKNVTISRYPHANVPKKEEIGNITVHHPRYTVIPKILGFMHALFMYFPLMKLVRSLVQNDKIDLINAHWVFPDGVAATWVAKKLSRPIILSGLGCDINYYPTLPFRKGLIQHALGAADAVTVKGNSLKKNVLRLNISENKVSVISNGVDARRFRIMERTEARQQLGISGSGPFILTVGSLDQVKGTRYLIDALKAMASEMKIHPRLLVIGDGPLKDDLFCQAERLGIAEKVSFFGKRPYDEIPLWMNAADLFCLPSIREGWPNALIEALACGTPAVASDVGSVSEIIHERNGLLARPGDSKNLCLQLIACLERVWNREAICATVTGFTWDECAELYMRTYWKVLRESRSMN